MDTEQSRLFYATRAAKGIHWRPDTYIAETAFLNHLPPACTRQATSNSSSPKVDILDGRFGDRIAVRDVRELKPPSRP